MIKRVFANVKECDLVSVNYNGRTYYVDEFMHEQDVCMAYPRCRVEFMPAPHRLVPDAPKDSRCIKCPSNDFNIDKVTFNGPKTIVEWKDGTKTIVNCNDEYYDPEKGLAMAIVKKIFGNKGNYYNTFRKAMENARYYNQPENSIFNRLGDALLAGWLAGFNDYRKQKEKCNE